VSSDLSAALDKLPVPNWSGGSGRIAGRVRDGNGNGVAGVTIRATQHGQGITRRKGDGPPARDTLDEAVRKAVKNYHWRRQTTVDAVTDESGAYSLEGLADRDYTLSAYREGYDAKPSGGAQVWKVRPSATIDWLMHPVVTVPVDVLLPDGTRPAQAWVECKQGSTTASESWSPARREIRVSPGTYRFTVNIGGNEEFRSEPVDATVEAGRDAEPITFRLTGRPGIRGTVRFAGGERFSNLRAYALRFGDRGAPTREQLGAQGKERWIFQQNGFEFSFLDIPPGRYLLGVGSRRADVFATATVDVGERLATTEIVVEEIDPKFYVVVRVLGPGGEPAGVDDVSTSYETENSSSSGGSTWARRADGSYIVFHHDHDYAEGGTYGIEMTAKEYGKKEIRYERGKEREFELRFRAPATLEVVVSGFAGAQHADKVSLGLRKAKGAKRRSHAAANQAPDGAGRARLGPVEEGDYEVVLFIRAAGHQQIPAVRKPISLPAGKSEMTLPMPRLHELVINGRKGEQFVLQGDYEQGARFHLSQRCGDDGRAVFAPLPAGTFKLRKSNGPGEMEVNVPGPPVVFKAAEYNALKVSIQDPEGALAQAGFADGDLVLAVNGTEFRGTAQMQLVFGGAMMKGGDATLTILRGGQTVELTVDLQNVTRDAGNRPGGSVRPTTR
jgi:hypothetical protein